MNTSLCKQKQNINFVGIIKNSKTTAQNMERNIYLVLSTKISVSDDQ